MQTRHTRRITTLTPFLAVIALFTTLMGCSQSGPDANDVRLALMQNVHKRLQGCDLLLYSDVTPHAKSPLADRPNVQQIVVSYDVQSQFYGHDQSGDLPSEKPTWMSDSCWQFFTELKDAMETEELAGSMRQQGAMVNSESTQDLLRTFGKVVGMEMRHLDSSPQEVPAILDGKSIGHVSNRTINLQPGEDGWQLVE